MQRLVLCLILFSPWSAMAQESYPRHPDSLKQEGVPEGKVEGPFTWKSEIFPGTERQYWIYVPAQYDTKEPACVFILQDGMNRARGWHIPVTLDNLIHKKEVPVQIGIFVSPGVVPAPHEDAQSRFNRSFEYDGLGPRYADFLIKEILPEVAKRYNLSDDPNDRCIGGSSSGAIAAFTAAWERPDQFRRVLSTVGTFVSLRGGDAYPALIRKVETKPLRVFLQDGSNDNNLYGGSWWHANQTMLSSLQFAGYDVKHVWGEGGHNSKHSAAIMPDALRWLWQDYPEPVKAGTPPKRRTDLLIEGEDWQLVSDGHQFTEGPVVNDKGELFFTDIPANRIHKVVGDKVTVFAKDTARTNGLTFGPDGKLYGCRNGDEQIVRYDADGNMEVLLEKAPANDLLILANGIGYYTDPENRKVWRFTAEGERVEVDAGIEFPNGLAASPDQTLLNVSDTRGRFTFSYQIQKDGSLRYKQAYGHLHVPDTTHHSGGDGMAVDTEGRLYVTTRIGLQVLDQLGRVHFIFTKPNAGWLSNVAFGGKDRDIVYVTCGKQVYRRRIKAKGVQSWQAPVKPPKPRL